jgi:hypothetical protein
MKDVSSFIKDVSSFIKDVSSFIKDVSSFIKDVSSFMKKMFFLMKKSCALMEELPLCGNSSGFLRFAQTPCQAGSFAGTQGAFPFMRGSQILRICFGSLLRKLHADASWRIVGEFALGIARRSFSQSAKLHAQTA